MSEYTNSGAGLAMLKNLDTLTVVIMLPSVSKIVSIRTVFIAPAGEVLLRCIHENLWIHMHEKWWPPYHWGRKFGNIWMQLDWEPILANPYHLIANARTKELTDQQRIAVDKFESRVKAYYAADFTGRLQKTIDLGEWY